MKAVVTASLLLASLPIYSLAASIPQLTIDTENAARIVSKQEYRPGTISILDGNGDLNFSGPLEIRLHGNSSLRFPKTSFKIKLSQKSPLLGMPEEKEWVLIANYSDKTLLRNHLALELSHSLGARYAPRNLFVELTLNGNYLGNFLLTEQIDISPDRLNIAKADPRDLTGGYLMEIFHSPSGKASVTTPQNVIFNLKAPKSPTHEQANYIRNYLLETEAALFSDHFQDPVIGYASYIDVDQFINWYLVNELFRNQDSGNFASIYLHKNRGAKLAMGPVWDFDIAAGNIDYDDNFLTEGWWVQVRSPWFARLFQDPAFLNRVKQRWREIRRAQIERLFRQIDSTAQYLQESQARNFKRWPILDQKVWPNYVVSGSYEGEVAYLKAWLRKRVQWLDQQWTL